MENRIYLCIDLKSFYASVECVDRGLDPFRVNLVVADPDRGGGSMCLAVSPAMKALGVPGRCRVFEIPKNIKYITAKPRMSLYLQKSAQIVGIYMKYICPDDMHVYSCDEVFIDATDYLKMYKKSAKELADMLRNEVFRETGICATAGIGTNLFLAKIALDIVAKHVPDHIGILDEESYREHIWFHTPITDIWNVGHGTAARLAKLGVYNMYGVTTLPESLMYKTFGVNARFLIDHAWGRESCTMADIKAYRPSTKSISNSQILFSDYSTKDAKLIMNEMLDTQILQLVRQGFVTGLVSLYVGYSKDINKPLVASKKLTGFTASRATLTDAFGYMYDTGIDERFPVRRIGIALGNLIPADERPITVFTDTEEEEREISLLRTIAAIQDKHGKNSMLRGRDYEKCATLRARNGMIGGHNAQY